LEYNPKLFKLVLHRWTWIINIHSSFRMSYYFMFNHSIFFLQITSQIANIINRRWTNALKNAYSYSLHIYNYHIFMSLYERQFFSPNSGGSLSTLYQCKLSSDQRSLLFDPYESESGSIKSGSEDSKPGIPPVDINKVQFTEIHFIPDEDKKGRRMKHFTSQMVVII
jgi:hypothetical protein